tara:strand:- start:249 stop:629 length:381 start_codon:yes stop_codon:yes gene_type:complete
MIEKHEEAYKSISEVAKILNLVNQKTGKINTHTLRYWEKHFKQIKPKIFSGKRRYYDLKSIKVLKKIKYLLKEQGMTISGVKKCLYKEKFLDLDVLDNRSINNQNIVLKSKLTKISKLIKEIKKLG